MLAPMKAMVHRQYGAFDLLRLEEIAQPSLKPDAVLVRVHAAALHVGDVFAVHGSPYLMRAMTGFLRPKYGVPGFDLAGRVEQVGGRVTRFRAGDEVFGSCNGACAQFAVAQAEHLATKPASVSFEQAAALSTSGLAALHALRDVARVRPGQKVLIIGAAGGVGTYAVQLAKVYGAQVTGVCSTRNLELIGSLGADYAIDYTREDFVSSDVRYDVILDNIENRSLTEVRRVLAPQGLLILNSGTGASGVKMFARLLAPLVLSPFSRQNLRRYLSMPKHADLAELAQLVDAGRLKPVVDRTYALEHTADALAYIETGHARGKVVICM